MFPSYQWSSHGVFHCFKGFTGLPSTKTHPHDDILVFDPDERFFVLLASLFLEFWCSGGVLKSFLPRFIYHSYFHRCVHWCGKNNAINHPNLEIIYTTYSWWFRGMVEILAFLRLLVAWHRYIYRGFLEWWYLHINFQRICHEKTWVLHDFESDFPWFAHPVVCHIWIHIYHQQKPQISPVLLASIYH